MKRACRPVSTRKNDQGNRRSLRMSAKRRRDARGRFVAELHPSSIADLAAVLTPQQAARVNYLALMLRANSVQDEYTRRIDEMLHSNAEHRWFTFCLDAIARQA